MKKRILLAVAALATISGSVMAQVTLTSKAALTTPAARTITLDGVTAAGDDVMRMTVDGTYNFTATGTDMAAELGATWASVVDGTKLDLGVGAGATTGVPDGTVAQVSINDEFSYAATGAQTFDLTETIYDQMGNVLACTFTQSYDVTVLAKPTVTVSQTKTAFCATENPVITLTFNSDVLDYQFRATLSATSGGAGAAAFTDQYFDVTEAQTATSAIVWDLDNFTNNSPGLYNVALDEIYDEVSVTATNNVGLGTVTNGSVNFAIVPTPKPTLSTTAVK